MKYQVHDFEIKDYHKVLDVGSGRQYYERADVLVDYYMPPSFLTEERKERWQVDGSLGVDLPKNKQFVCANGQALPFCDKVFDFSFCRQVLEHVEDPVEMVSELSRVSKAGYISVPASFAERLLGWMYHRWRCHYLNGKLYFISNDRYQKSSRFGDYFGKRKNEDDELFELTNIVNCDLWHINFVWRGSISAVIAKDHTGDSTVMTINERIALIEKHKKYREGIHGKKHARNVCILAARIAERCGGDQEVIQWAALLHDIGRVNDGVDPWHGKRGAIIAERIMKKEKLKPNMEMVEQCIVQHCESSRILHEAKVVSDADKLDRFRFGKDALNEDLLELGEWPRMFIERAKKMNGIDENKIG
jgi:putative nucleotidyltransferase with HDIG domain